MSDTRGLLLCVNWDMYLGYLDRQQIEKLLIFTNKSEIKNLRTSHDNIQGSERSAILEQI